MKNPLSDMNKQCTLSTDVTEKIGQTLTESAKYCQTWQTMILFSINDHHCDILNGIEI